MPFEIHAWSSSEGVWKPMHRHRIPQWKPKPNPIDAATRALVWTGMGGVPAMQVVDQADGAVVWRESSRYPAAGDPITPEWNPVARAAATRELRELHTTTEPPRSRQPTLFDLA